MYRAVSYREEAPEGPGPIVKLQVKFKHCMRIANIRLYLYIILHNHTPWPIRTFDVISKVFDIDI